MDYSTASLVDLHNFRQTSMNINLHKYLPHLLEGVNITESYKETNEPRDLPIASMAITFHKCKGRPRSNTQRWRIWNDLVSGLKSNLHILIIILLLPTIHLFANNLAESSGDLQIKPYQPFVRYLISGAYPISLF
jgi:hypothetical protein